MLPDTPTKPVLATENAIDIRPATPLDTSNITRLLLEWHGTSLIDYPPPVELDVLRWVLRIFDNGGGVWVAERGKHERDLRRVTSGRLIGVIGIQPMTFEWNKQAWYFGDAFFYVNANYRRSGTANGLLKVAKLHAAARRIPLITAIITGDQPERLERYYSIKGGVYAGGIMAFGLDTKETTDELPVRGQRVEQHDHDDKAAAPSVA